MSNYITKTIPETKPEVKLVTRPGFLQSVCKQSRLHSEFDDRITGQRLSLQSHTGRAELWIVLDDGAIVQVGDTITECKAGDEIWIPANERHRLSCQGKQSVRVLEVAFGNCNRMTLTRYDDDYKR
jgi:mannose-1-phosphate guanylyltransferase/mannose-6-phosphate isomerase